MLATAISEWRERHATSRRSHHRPDRARLDLEAQTIDVEFEFTAMGCSAEFEDNRICRSATVTGRIAGPFTYLD